MIDPIPDGALPVMGGYYAFWSWTPFGGMIYHRMPAAPWHTGCKFSDQVDYYPPLGTWLDHETVCD